MAQMVPTEQLEEHPLNDQYFRPVSEEKYNEIMLSIDVNGIREPIKVKKGTNVVLCGHTRLRIARELQLPEVPIEYIDVDTEDEEVYLLIADNEERRGSEDDSLMHKARRAKFLMNYWGVVRGGNYKKQIRNKKAKDIANMLGQSQRTVNRLIRLNFLIKVFQDMIEAEELQLMSGVEISYLPETIQTKLYEEMGDEISSMPLDKLKFLCKQLREAVGQVVEDEQEEEYTIDSSVLDEDGVSDDQEHDEEHLSMSWDENMDPESEESTDSMGTLTDDLHRLDALATARKHDDAFKAMVGDDSFYEYQKETFIKKTDGSSARFAEDVKAAQAMFQQSFANNVDIQSAINKTYERLKVSLDIFQRMMVMVSNNAEEHHDVELNEDDGFLIEE